MKTHQPNTPKPRFRAALLKLNKPGAVRSRDKRVYQTDGRGVVTRVSPQRPWRGKSERRAVIKARRQAREECQ